ncbi:unnamed protein product [Arabidopsis lyrata]|uniref:uncharacterized protein LOC110226201 n=1 Tax=Arabidopsis lyrata subsp. lyrata TaxID=81972 RepID=UPI000A29BCA9|nr:uncharacterized protein LOC110226201 [Arabidopsis lyrata subsp. lyrata]CAH8276040.1 unnamed protein product [Arabidopsis lyrata]|eukprot:XP_020872595.1 uncharacterized protein LOC110226201 [Arabidopsis lyrata subsp. lyrata]
MECNKDEARRAIDIAERKLSQYDYNGAKKFVTKAQNLYPNLDGLKQVLLMIDVYISATNKINGEADWYGILGVDPIANDEAVKKRYKKLALLLHPDKNKFKGAEGAFKLVSQAWCVLSDKVNRIVYDQKRKSKEANTGMQKPPTNPQKPASHNGNQNAGGCMDPSAAATSDKPASGMPKPVNPNKPASSNGLHQNARDCVDLSAKSNEDSILFWTMCNGCKTQCSYLMVYLYKAILCPKCGQTFIATEITPCASVVRPANISSSPQQQHHYSAQIKATNRSTNGALSSGSNSSPSASAAAQKTPQVSASSSGRVYSPSVSATAKTPQVSVLRPVIDLSSSPEVQQQQKQQWSAKNISGGTYSQIFASSSASAAAQKTPQASASSSGRFYSPSVSATARTPQVSVLRPVINLSSSPEVQQQWSAQNISGGTYSQSFASSSASAAAQKTPQASASSGRVYSPSVSATAKTPQASVLRPVINLSSSPEVQQQWSAQNISGGTSSQSFASSSASAAQKTPQASASSSGRVYSPSISATAKTPQVSVLRPIVNLSSSPQLQQQWSAQNTSAGTYSQSFASSSVSAAQKTPQASASSLGRVSSPSVSATAKTPQASAVQPVVNLSSSTQVQQQQQWSAQNTSGDTYSQSFASSSVSYTYSYQWSCSVSVTANSSSGNAVNQGQESSKRVHEVSQETVAAAEKVLKKPRRRGQKIDKK